MKYNDVVKYYVEGTKNGADFLREQKYKFEKTQNNVVNEFNRGLKEKVKDWTEDDFAEFIEISKHDDRLDAADCLNIVLAYKSTHKQAAAQGITDDNIALVLMAMDIRSVIR